jgi:phosphatidylserine/phosphatidylglycerophosphate/cardiolipin synthase-like enzyme
MGPLSVLSTWLFRPIRRLFGPLHRRRPVLDHDQNDDLPPLPPPWTDPRWFRGGFPPRAHTALTPLVDGEAYLSDLHDQLLSARERVTICGWCLTPLLALRRPHGRGDALLAEVLREVSERAEVYVLIWAGSPALFEPTTSMVEKRRAGLERIAPRVHCRLDRAPFSHDHHQKAVTIDGRVAYLGGMDLTTFQGDRWDSSRHPLRFGPNWHDVQMRLEGEIVHDVEENFCQRWNAVTGDRLKPLSPGDEPSELKTHTSQLIRTIPAGFYDFAPRGEFGIHHALTTAIRGAERLIYLENQYLWSPEIVGVLEEAMDRSHPEPFRIVVVLPAQAEDGKYDNDDHVRRLTEKDAGRGIFSVYSLYTGGPATGHTGYRYLPIYVHAKVSIVDDEWLSVGSANLNGRGLATDTEINVQCIDPHLARSLRVRLWAEHLGMTEEDVAAADPTELADKAWPLAAREMERQLRSGGRPPASTVRRYVPGQSLGSRVLDVVQNATLEH